MIDIHSHVLYEVDDGAKSLEEARISLKQACDNGVTDMILTPHSWAFAGEKNMDWLKVRFEKFQMESTDLPIRLHLGMEHAVDDYRRFIRRIEKEGVLTLAGSQYVLVEAMGLNSEDEAEELVYEMKLRGYVPILAHPERMRTAKKNSKIIRAFRKAGGYAQLTLESCNPKDKCTFHKVATRLLKEKEADFIATDCHGTFRTCEKIAEIQGRIEKAYGKGFVDELMIINPGKVIGNEAIKKRR